MPQDPDRFSLIVERVFSLAILLTILAILFLLMLVMRAGGQEPVLPQVVLTYAARTKIQGDTIDIVKVPKEELVLLGLIPLDHQAPLPEGSTMICRAESVSVGVESIKGEEKEPRDEILFRCGSQRYLFSKLDIESKEKQKQ